MNSHSLFCNEYLDVFSVDPVFNSNSRRRSLHYSGDNQAEIGIYLYIERDSVLAVERVAYASSSVRIHLRLPRTSVHFRMYIPNFMYTTDEHFLDESV